MKTGLQAVIHRFPMKETPDLPLSKTMDEGEIREDEAILRESLQEIRDQNMEFAVAFLRRDPFRGTKKDRWILTFTEADVEPLLKITNNVRIGCWAKMGYPEDIHAIPESPELREAFYLMYVCGVFQEAVIEAPENQEEGG